MTLFSGQCDVPARSNNYNQHGTSYDTMRWIAIGCTAVTATILFVLKAFHIHNYTRPKEQRQIVRILIAPSVWSLVCMGQILDYSAAQYIQPLGEVYESIYLCCVFLLFIQYAAPDSDFDGDMFDTVRAAHEGKDVVKVDWPRITWIMVFQFPVINAISAILTEGTEAAGTYCNGNFDPKFGYLWATVIQGVGLGAAVTSMWRFYKHMEKRLRARRGLAKLIGFKALVGLMYLQQLIFGILLDQKVIKPSDTFSYVDLLYGLPNVIGCAEMVLFALWFWWVCSPHEYSPEVQGRRPLPAWKAIPDSLNPKDWILGIGRLFSVSMYMHRSGGFKQWQAAKAEKKAAGNSTMSKFTRAHATSALLYGNDDQAYNQLSGYPEQYNGYPPQYNPATNSAELLEYPTKSRA